MTNKISAHQTSPQDRSLSLGHTSTTTTSTTTNPTTTTSTTTTSTTTTPKSSQETHRFEVGKQQPKQTAQNQRTLKSYQDEAKTSPAQTKESTLPKSPEHLYQQYTCAFPTAITGNQPASETAIADWMIQKYGIPASQRDALIDSISAVYKHLPYDGMKGSRALFTTAMHKLVVLAKAGKLNDITKEAPTRASLGAAMTAMVAGASPSTVRDLLRSPNFQNCNDKQQIKMLLATAGKGESIRAFLDSKEFGKLSKTEQDTATHLLCQSKTFTHKPDGSPRNPREMAELLQKLPEKMKKLSEYGEALKSLSDKGGHTSKYVLGQMAALLKENPQLLSLMPAKQREAVAGLLLVGVTKLDATDPGLRADLRAALQNLKQDNPSLLKVALLGARAKMGDPAALQQYPAVAQKELNKTLLGGVVGAFTKHVGANNLAGALIAGIYEAAEGSLKGDSAAKILQNTSLAVFESLLPIMADACFSWGAAASAIVSVWDAYAHNSVKQENQQKIQKFLQENQLS